MKYIKTYNNFLLEKRMDIKDYPNKDYLGLVVKSIKRNSNTIKYLTLYDFKNNLVLAHIELNNLMNKNSFEIQRSYAVKGYGPLIYDFALMYSYPNPVAPAKIIQPTAINVWRYYYELRDDVIKKNIEPNDDLYSNKYNYDDMDENDKSDENLKYLNTYYFLKPSDEFFGLVEKGNEFLQERGFNPSDLFKLGNKEFKKKYLSL